MNTRKLHKAGLEAFAKMALDAGCKLTPGNRDAAEAIKSVTGELSIRKDGQYIAVGRGISIEISAKTDETPPQA